MSTMPRRETSVHVSRSPERDRSVTELMGDVARESADIVRKEIELAKLEGAEKLGEAKRALGGMAIGGPILFAGILILLQAAVLGLDLFIQEPWLSATIVGGGTVLVGLTALLVGRSHARPENLKPDRSMTSLRRDQETIARHVRSR